MASSHSLLSFDSLYAIVCQELRASGTTEGVLLKLKSAASDYDRIKLILEEVPNMIRLFQDNIKDNYEPKSEAKAKAFMEKCRQNNNCLQFLNKALLFCPNFIYNEKDNDISNCRDFIAFETSNSSCDNIKSNILKPSDLLDERSEVLFREAAAYDKCIQDIFMSVQNNGNKTFDKTFLLGQCYVRLKQFKEAKAAYEYSLALLRRSGLDNERKSKEAVKVCKAMKDLVKEESLESQNGPLDMKIEFKEAEQLFNGCNKSITGTSSAVSLKYLEGRGRHMIATRLIPPGSTLIVERPYVWSVAPKEYETLCQACVSHTKNPIPCGTCASVIFCSLDCYRKAYEFHSLECKILKLIDSSEKLGKMGLLCFRTIAKTPFEEVKEEFSKWNSPNNTLMLETVLGLDSQGVLDSSKYSSVYAQTPNSHERNAGDLFKRTVAAVYLTLCLRYTGYFKDKSPREDIKLTGGETIAASALLRHLQSLSCNAYGINLIGKGTQTLEIEEVGGATYPVISTTNHSCDPNVYRINVGNTCVVKCLREIGEGDEILDSYGPQFTTMAVEDRLEELARQYLFVCLCVACMNNWGRFEDVKSAKVSWKCPSGCCDGGVLEVTGGNKRKCIKCGETSEVKKLQKMLNSAEEKYLKAKDGVIRETCEPGEIEKVLRYIVTAQKLLKQPCIEVVEGQEILKLYWNLRIKNSG